MSQCLASFGDAASFNDLGNAMTIFWEKFGLDVDLTSEDLREGIEATLAKLGHPQKILALPPDHTRLDSRAGEMTCLLHQVVGDRLKDVMLLWERTSPWSPSNST